MEDIIKRADAIKAIEDLPNAYNGWSDAYDKAYIIGTLEEVPSAEPKQGEWIDRTKLKGFPEYECSACHAYGQQWMTFCPHCGARMTDKDIDVPYKIASDQRDYDSTYEPAYNEQDGSM